MQWLKRLWAKACGLMSFRQVDLVAKAQAEAIRTTAEAASYSTRTRAKAQAKATAGWMATFRDWLSQRPNIIQARAQAKKIKEEAKAAKWRAFGHAMSRLFVALRNEIRRTIRTIRARRAAKSSLKTSPAGLKMRTKLANAATLGLMILWTVLIALSIFINSKNLGLATFFGGPFAISAVRFFAKQPRPFFPRMGMAVFGPLLLLWALFSLGSRV